MVIKTDVLANRDPKKTGTKNRHTHIYRIMSKRRHRHVFVCMKNSMKVCNLLEKHKFIINNTTRVSIFSVFFSLFCCQLKKNTQYMFMQTNFRRNFLPLSTVVGVSVCVCFFFRFSWNSPFSCSEHNVLANNLCL